MMKREPGRSMYDLIINRKNGINDIFKIGSSIRLSGVHIYIPRYLFVNEFRNTSKYDREIVKKNQNDKNNTSIHRIQSDRPQDMGKLRTLTEIF